jgi:hypothetical protein
MFKRHVWHYLKDLDAGFMSYILDLMVPVACESEQKGQVVASIIASVPSFAIWTKLFAKLRKVDFVFLIFDISNAHLGNWQSRFRPCLPKGPGSMDGDKSSRAHVLSADFVTSSEQIFA